MDRNSEPDITVEERALAERGAVLIAAAVRETVAPQSLREAIERDRSRASAPAPRRSFLGRVLSPAGLGTVAAAVIAVGGGVALISSGGNDGSSSGPSVTQVAALSGLPSLSPPPAVVGNRLKVHVANITFPSWKSLQWSATGKRIDKVAGRSVTTVFYRGATGATVGYSIVDGSPLGGWPAGEVYKRGTSTYRAMHGGGRTVLIWNQQNHTCIVSAPSSVPDSKLVKLASTEVV